MTFRRPFPLRWHLVLLVVGTLLPVVAFGAAMVGRLARSERAAAERRLTQSARDLASVVDREMSGTFRALSALGQSERLDRGDLAAFHEEARRVLATQPTWLAVLLFAPDGSELLDSSRPPGSQLLGASEPASLERALRTRQPVVGDLARGRLTGKLAFPIRIPVVRGGELRYVLTAVIAPEAIGSLVSQERTGPEEWTRAVVDGKGILVARTRDPERFTGKLSTPPFLLQIRQAREGLFPGITMDGTPVYTAFNRARLSDWTVSVAVPREVLDGPVRRSLLLFAGIGLALLAVSGTGAFLFSRHLSGSIESAALAAGTLARGDRPVVAPSSVAEVALLAAALERSADLLLAREQALNEHLAHTEAARADAETASRAKDEFLAMLGHELRNPLGPILNGVHLLRELLPPEERTERIRAMIERQVAHISRMVDDLLETSRITRSKIVLETRSLDLRAAAREVCDGFRYSFEQARIALHCAVPETPVWIDGDETRLAQCLGNLLHNALKFTPADGKVFVSLATDGEQARLEVRDDGCGIDPALLPALFQPFSQGPQAIDRRQGGLGLGLALVKGLVELHGGTVRAFSAGSGQGTRFTILLPLAVPREEPVPAAAGEGEAIPQRILIVEDMRDAAESLEMLLTLAGHEARIAASGQEALEIAAEHAPDVVICDIGLPDIDGYTLARKLREIPALRATRFVALTGYGQEEDVRRAHDAGFAVHLTKPVEPERLRQVLRVEASPLDLDP
jgi:signal transduction histidine kinase/ActR/RegA family two-component response regulator